MVKIREKDEEALIIIKEINAGSFVIEWDKIDKSHDAYMEFMVKCLPDNVPDEDITLEELWSFEREGQRQTILYVVDTVYAFVSTCAVLDEDSQDVKFERRMFTRKEDGVGFKEISV